VGAAQRYRPDATEAAAENMPGAATAATNATGKLVATGIIIITAATANADGF